MLLLHIAFEINKKELNLRMTSETEFSNPNFNVFMSSALNDHSLS